MLTPFIVRGAPYVPLQLTPPPPAAGPTGIGGGGGGIPPMNVGFGWPVDGDVLLSFTRAPVRRDRSPFRGAVIDTGDLQRFPFEPTAALLERQPAYPRSGHALVLRDGLPLNHAFEGTVNWRKAQRETLGKIELLSAGSAAAWGEARGVVHLLSAPLRAKPLPGNATPADRRGADNSTVTVVVGTDARHFEQWLTVPTGGGALQFGLAASDTEERGTATASEADVRSALLTARWQTYVSPNAQLSLIGRSFVEKRDEPATRARERDLSGTAQLVVQTGALAWQALAFVQHQPIETEPSEAVALSPAGRSTRVVPTTLGGDVTVLASRDSASTTFGASYRAIRATIDERAPALHGRSDREIASGHLIRDQPVGGAWRVSYGGRWETSTDRSRISPNPSGHPVDHRERDTRFSPVLGATWRHGTAWVVQLGAQRGPARATLRERFEAERRAATVQEISRWRTELGIEWRSFDPAPPPEVLTVGRSFITLPARAPHQRMSAGLRIFGERARAQSGPRFPGSGERDTVGGEARLAWTPAKSWRGEFAYLVAEAGPEPGLVLPQTPTRREGIAMLEIPAGKLRGMLAAVWRDEPVAGDRREDRLLLRLGATYPWTERTLLFGSVETSHGSRQVPTLTLAPRKSVRVGLRRGW